MRKIPTLFERDPDDRARVTREVNPLAAWVLEGEGTATRKYDGTSCLIEGGRLWKRYEVKRGKMPPTGFRPADDIDDVTGKQPGWVPVSANRPDDQWHREAYWYSNGDALPDGTYELVGPKIQGNPERFDQHDLVPHGQFTLDAPRDYDGLRTWLLAHDYEGIVWHHPDGRMAKLKRKDFA